MRRALLLLPLLFAVACHGATRAPTELPVGSARFADPSWDDGMAVVLAFEGRVRRYGEWREARARDYLVREHLDRIELTKRDLVAPELVPVLKATRILEFSTGSYDYRLMSSLFFRRADGALVKGLGTCINACGLVFQRWDEPSGLLRTDSYWEGEGRAEAALAPAGARFADELGFLGSQLEDGQLLRVRPPLASPHSILQPRVEAAPALQAWLGVGDLCTECVLPPEGLRGERRWSAAAPAPRAVPERLLRVQREGLRTRLLAEDGTLELELVHDERGFLAGWTLRDEQEFRRVAVYRGPYWERTAPSDGALLGR